MKKKRRRINKVVKEKINWTKYIIELLVVFIGVTSGFLLNTWRLENSESKLKNKYLKSFYNEVIEDKISLDSLIVRSNIRTENLLKILRKTEVVNKPITDTLAREIINIILYVDWFAPTDDTYDDIINSGNLNIISNYKLKEKISSYYSFQKEVKNVEQFYKNHMNDHAFPIIYKTYHLYKREFINNTCYQSMEFSNMYMGVLALLQQNNNIYKQILEKNIELQKELAKVLKIKT